ncbi:uncharacterized protein N7484_011427 [Penicillium longicatenatum]|uniref:uncharacterized protein n=1 Tax=Penicillium longicatenatum TaxID=1561947 RepID=UPI002546FC3A|nr:uncharacterized protein N7484_011427 [Penicillium longicatenatum]KAJ5631327.1 hypothetical protein N7484_011427 [Penicillium longicatenatum]
MQSPPTKGSVYPEQETRVIIPAKVSAIKTQRLYLRPIERSDAADIFEYRRRQDVADFLWPKIPHREIQDTEAMIIGKTFKTPDASGALGRHFSFAVMQLDDPTEKIIGMVGINALVPAPSIGYGIHPDFWGKGFVSEAVAGVVDAWWKLERKSLKLRSAKAALESEKLYAACNKANVGSVKVLLRNGFEIYEEMPLMGDTVTLFSLQRPGGLETALDL